MAFRRRGYRTRGVRRGMRKHYRRKATGVSRKVKSYVKKAIHKNVENKEVISFAANQPLSCTVSPNAPNGIPLIPAIAQGTQDNQRIGNMVRCVKGYIRGRVNLVPYATTNPLSTPILVKMYLLRHLGINGQVNFSNLDWTNLFRINGATAGFQNLPLDCFLPINEDYWRILGSKEFKIGAANATATGQVGTGGYFDNSPMSVPFYFNFGKKMRKQLKYSEGSSPSNFPTNDNCYLAIQVVNADGSQSATTPAEWHYVTTFKYEDA